MAGFAARVPGADGVLRRRANVGLRDHAAARPQRGQIDAELDRQRSYAGQRPRGRPAPVALDDDLGQRVADCGARALDDEEPRDPPGDRRRDLDHRLVGLDLDEGLVPGDRVSLPDQPSDDLGAGEALSQIREQDQMWVAQKRRTSSSARTTRSTLGTYRSSSDQYG